MKYMIIVVAAIILAYLNYRRFVPRERSLGDKDCKYDVREITVECQDRTIRGELLLPQGISGKIPTVIVSHGLNSNGRNARKLIGNSLARSGLQVFCFDFWGGNLHSRSGGNMNEMTVFTEKEDLEAVIKKIRSLETTDADNLFLLGESQGGFVTGITAADHPEIKAVIEYYPAYCIPEDARKRHVRPEDIPEEEHLMASRLGRNYSASVWDYDVYDVIGSYKGPVLIIHGEHDKIVDISYGRKAYEVYEDAEFVRLPGEIHGFTTDGRIKAARIAYDFIQRKLYDSSVREILTIDAELGRSQFTQKGSDSITVIPFTGKTSTKYFTGKIQPGATDTQQRKLWKIEKFVADYTLKGKDYTGQECEIHIVNTNTGKGWKPAISTDSKALDFFNHGTCEAQLFGHKDQLVVRVLADTLPERSS